MNIGLLRRHAADVCAMLFVLAAGAATVAAQTLQLTDSSATVLRGGTYANTNLSSDTLLVTRASADPEYIRRILLKFDTQNPIPLNTPIASAKLTLTVAGGNAESRKITAYRVANSYQETESTWNKRNVSAAWTKAGGDLGDQYGAQTVTSAIGSRVTYDVTALVQATVNGKFGSSRYTRIALVDIGASSKESYKEYYSDEAGDVNVRPLLTVTLGSASAPAPAPAPTPAPTTGAVTLKVLHWNLHHGVGTDGKYDINRIATWMAKMNPDVITLNEVEKFTGWGYEDQPARYKAMLESKTGKKWYSMFAQEFGNWTSNGKGHQILSTYPIESTDMVEISYDRVVAMARITVNGRPISLITTHFDPSSTTRRLTQAIETTRWSAPRPENRIVTGDLNAWPDQTSIAEMNKTYADSWAVAASLGMASSFSGNSPFGATKNGRIDYIFYSKNAVNLVVKRSQVVDTRDAYGVMPSDHRPVLTTFEVR
jgi:endonuclease/exonuclease/phosphatase family metal-dependent hydrolase